MRRTQFPSRTVAAVLLCILSSASLIREDAGKNELGESEPLSFVLTKRHVFTSPLRQCRSYPGRPIYDSLSCFLEPSGKVAISSDASIVKHVIEGGTQSRIAVRGPSSADVVSKTLALVRPFFFSLCAGVATHRSCILHCCRVSALFAQSRPRAQGPSMLHISVHSGLLSLALTARYSSSVVARSVAAAASELARSKGDIDVSIPFLPDGASQDWEIVMTAEDAPCPAGADEHALRRCKDLAASMAPLGDAAGNAGAIRAADAVISIVYEAAAGSEHAEETAVAARGPPGAPTPLIDGSPFSGSLASRTWEYFSFVQPQPLSQRLDILVTSIMCVHH